MAQTTEYRQGDSEVVIWFKIAQKLDELLGGASTEETRPKAGDEKLVLMKKALNSLNSGAI